MLESVFYGDLVYKFKTIVVNPNISDQFKTIIKHYKNAYDMDTMQQSSCLVVNQSRFIAMFSFARRGSGLRLIDGADVKL